MPSGQFPFNYPAATSSEHADWPRGISSALRLTVTRWGERRGKYSGEGGGCRQAKAIRVKRWKEERPAGGPNQV